jgi:thiamine biosynthesis lipoprotein
MSRPPSLTPPSPIATARFPLWGGEAVVASCEQSGLATALAHSRRTITAFDEACSSFRGDSELSLLNAAAGRRLVVSPLLFRAVQAAVNAARVTDGAVDPTVGEALIAHGVNPAIDGRRFRIRAVSGYGVVDLDEAALSVLVPAGVRLDLGATAKALAADQAAAAAAQACGCGVLVSLCGDVSVAGEPPADGWAIRVTDDHRRVEGQGQTVAIQSGGIATSSTTVRRAGPEPDAASHLIDPGTGAPVSGPWRTVTVHADTCVAANTASTAAMVLGERAVGWLQAHDLTARLVTNDGRVVRVGGWPADGDDLESAR